MSLPRVAIQTADFDLAAELAVISLSVPIGYSMSHEGVDTDNLSRTLLGVWLDGAVR